MGQYFIPNTTVYIFAGTDIDENNKPFITSMQNFRGWLGTFKNYAFNNYSYQRADDRQYIAVDMDYNEAIQCDLLIWNNQEHEPERWYVANITGVEFKNPNTTWIYFEIDAYCTFGEDIEWDTSISFVEREHVNDDWNGDVPNYDNIGSPEGINPILEKPIYAYGFTASDIFQYVVRDPFTWHDDGSVSVSSGIVRDGVFGLNVHVFDTSAEVNEYLQKVAENSKTDVEKIIDIQTIPKYVDNYSQIYLNPPWKAITLNNAKCFSSEFCMLRVESMAANTVSYKPELFADTDLNSIHFYMQLINPGGSYGMIVYPTQYPKGVTANGKFYGFKIVDFAHGSWTGDTFAQWLSINLLPSALRGILGGLQATTGAGMSIGGFSQNKADTYAMGMMQAGRGAENILSTITDFANARLHGTSTSGEFGMTNAGFATACKELGYRMSWYMPIDSTIKFIDTYFDRFGYKVMQLKVPNVHTRAYWNYVKTIEGHVDGDIPFFYRKKIEDMLNNGVTFWNIDNGRIGNFSNPAKNKEAITQ